MDVNILKQTSHEFKDINIVQNVGDALSEGPALTNLRQAFQQYFTLLKQYPMSVTTLSQYYEMVLMVLVQCDLNHKYIQMIQQLNSEDQLYLKELIEDLFTKLSTPSTNASNTQDIQYELTQLQFNYSKLLKENEELRQKQSQQTPASNKNTLHNDLSLAEDKINEMDVMIQKQSSIINDLTNKLQHQANLQHTNTTLKQEIEELKHKLIKFKKMESTNLVLNKKLDNLHDLEAHVKHLEQVNHELMNQLKGEPQKQQHDSLLNQEKRQLEIHQIQLQEELSATLDQLALLEQEKMAQLDYIHQLEEKISDLEKSATESPPSSAELLRQVNPSYSDQEKEQLIKENKDLQHQLLVFQAKSSNDNDPHDVLFETKLKEYVTQIQQLRHEKDSLNVLCDELKSNKSEISEKLENTTAQFKIKMEKYEKDKRMYMESINALKKMVDEQDKIPDANVDLLKQNLTDKQGQLDAMKRKFQDYVNSVQQEQRIMFGLIHTIGRQQVQTKVESNEEQRTMTWLTEQRRLLQQHLLRSQ